MKETKKSLGQHWLQNEDILQAIAEAGEVATADSVLEIGPGLGTLTKVLETKHAKITALEFDQDLIVDLHSKFADSEHVKIIQGDIRTFDLETMPKAYKIVANIPYYLTSNLIRRIADTTNKPSIAVLLVQKEVAERICAKPGDMGVLSVIAQFYYLTSLDIVVPAQLFTPPPKVDSQVVILRKRQHVLFELDERKFFQIVKAGFSEKRKTLRNSLAGSLALPKDEIVRMLQQAGLPENARAQELSLQDWYALYLVYGTSPTR